MCKCSVVLWHSNVLPFFFISEGEIIVGKIVTYGKILKVTKDIYFIASFFVRLICHSIFVWSLQNKYRT